MIKGILLWVIYHLLTELLHFRFIGELSDTQRSETDRFMEEMITDPAMRDKMSIIKRTFQNRQRVSYCTNLTSVIGSVNNMNKNNKLFPRI